MMWMHSWLISKVTSPSLQRTVLCTPPLLRMGEPMRRRSRLPPATNATNEPMDDADRAGKFTRQERGKGR
eukprot:3266047-Alexandrium_andersonii.AAC.1